MNATLKIAAVAVLVLAVGIGVVQFRPSTNNVGTDVSPSPSSSPLTWSSEILEQDWPGPIRDEPVGDPVVVPWFLVDRADPRGDIGSVDRPEIDIVSVKHRPCDFVCVEYAASDLGGSTIAPGEPWIAYGLVFDTDLDGVADVRLGMDRVPAELTPWGGIPGSATDRTWVTDLHAGTTEVGRSGVGTVCDCLYPGNRPGSETVETATAEFGPRHEPRGRFYAWASVIEDGQVVATDYAPDVGWLDRTLKVPSPSASPSPSPLVWTPASAQQDWPGRFRTEPVGDPHVVPLADGYTDPSGDIGSPDMPWIDIQRVYDRLNFVVAASPPSPLAGSYEPWIVYGLVLDTDLDGVPDVRFGMDIMHGDFTVESGRNPHVWRTDLHTGRTESVDDNDRVDGSVWLCDCGYPRDDTDSQASPGPKVRFAIRDRFPLHFYAWASVIQDGRVVATDYAPDTGWLDSTAFVPRVQ